MTHFEVVRGGGELTQTGRVRVDEVVFPLLELDSDMWGALIALVEHL